MRVPRRQISQALFAQLRTAYNWARSERGTEIWSNVAPVDQPFLGLLCPREAASEPQAWGLTRWERFYFAMIYMRRDQAPLEEGEYFSDLIDDLLDAIDKVLAGDLPGEANTLGGLVTQCTIEGDIMVDAGILDNQAVILVPIHVIVGI
jgi:hypothetical protein